ncbi:MAG: HAD hydrolase-like protein [bacterium]|nr:HAD hydrolase-like protein [bacterium]
MIKTIIFDTDGMIIHREMYFSERFSKEFNIPLEKILPFFKNEFQSCLIGKADLKIELQNYLPSWGWEKSVEELLSYWFTHESDLDKALLESVKQLRERSFKCYLDTNNDQYRTQYLLDTLGLKKMFDGVFSSAELGYLKPQDEFWAAVHDRLGKPAKSEVLVWDDDEKNVESAKKFGFLAKQYSDLNLFKNQMRLLLG